jgi:hypothetical protein
VTSSILDTALDVTHETLEIGSEVLQFAPVAGLGEAARVLLNIWNAVQLVEVGFAYSCKTDYSHNFITV